MQLVTIVEKKVTSLEIVLSRRLEVAEDEVVAEEDSVVAEAALEATTMIRVTEEAAVLVGDLEEVSVVVKKSPSRVDLVEDSGAARVVVVASVVVVAVMEAVDSVVVVVVVVVASAVVLENPTRIRRSQGNYRFFLVKIFC